MTSLVTARNKSARLFALLESFGAAAIWASSFVLAKITLSHAGPLTVASFQYFLAFIVLCPLLWNQRKTISKLPPGTWRRLVLLGITAYTIGDGATFVALLYLPATTESFLLSLISIPVVFAGAVLLQERPTRLQTVGLIICVGGTTLFFSGGLAPGEPLGLAITAIALLAFTAFAIIGRDIARSREASTIALTAIPLGIGGFVLGLIAIPIEGIPHVPITGWGLILILAGINTAVAYSLYNHSMQELTALETNVMQNLSPLMTAVWAWLILGNTLSWVQMVGITIVIGGVLLVQIRRR